MIKYEMLLFEIHLEKCSSSLVIRIKEMKTILRPHITPVRMTKETLTTHAHEDARKG